MSGRIGGDPARLEAYAEQAAAAVSSARPSVGSYRGAVSAFNSAGPNDLATTVVDRSARLLEALDGLEAANRLPPALAFALRQLDGHPLDPDVVHAFTATWLVADGEQDALRLLRQLAEEEWFSIPYAAFGLADASVSLYEVSLVAPFLRGAIRTYETEVLRFAHLDDGARLRAFLRWQEEVSQVAPLRRVLSEIPELDPYGRSLIASGQLPERLPRLRGVARVAGKVAIPLGIVLDGMVLLDPDASGTDRTFAAFGLYAGGVALVALAGFTIAPVVAVTAVIAGVAAAGYAIWQVLPAIGDAARAAWDWTSARASEAWRWTSDRASDAWDWTTEQAGAAWDWTGDRASHAWDWTTEQAGAAWDWTGDRASDAWGWTTDAADSAWDWSTDRVSDARGWTTDRLDSAGDAIGDAWDDLSGLGGSALETVGGWFD